MDAQADDPHETSGNEVSSTVMRKMGICYKIAKLMQTDGRSCLLERGLTNTDKIRKAAALRNLIHELTVLTGQNFTEKQITKCLSNMRNRLKERMSLSRTWYGERLGGWERELLSVYKQGGLMNELSDDASTNPTRKGSRARARAAGGTWERASPTALPTQVQRVASPSDCVRLTRNCASETWRSTASTKVPISSLKVTLPKPKPSPKAKLKLKLKATESKWAAVQRKTAAVKVSLNPRAIGLHVGKNGTSQSGRSAAKRANRSKADAQTTVLPALPTEETHLQSLALNDGSQQNGYADTFDAESTMRSERGHHSPPRSPGLGNAPPAHCNLTGAMPNACESARDPPMDHEPEPSDDVNQFAVQDDTTVMQTFMNSTKSHFEFESDETSRLTNEQLQRLLLLEQLAYVRLKRSLLAQRILADTSQGLLVDSRQQQGSTANGL